MTKNIKQQQHKLEMQTDTMTEPSMREMMDMFQGLAKQNKSLADQNDSLRQDVEELKKGGLKKKSMGPLEWLQTNIQPEISFQQWQNELYIEKSDMYLIFNTGFIKGNVNILQRLMLIREGLDDGGGGPPIFAFTQKRIIYQYNVKNWETLSMDVFTKFMDKINKNLMKNHYKKWIADNKSNICNMNSAGGLKCFRIMNIMMGGGQSKKELMPKIYNQWRNSMKQKLTDFI